MAEEIKKKRIAWNKGMKGVQVAWNKGKKMPQISGDKHHMWGKHWSNEMKNKLSESHKGQVAWNKGKKTGKPAWNKGIPMSEKQKKKLSNILKGMKKPHSIEHRKALSIAHMGKKGTNLGKKFSEEHKNKIRIKTLNMYETGSFPKQTNTKPERMIKEELIKRNYKEGIDFIHQYKFNNKFMCDFCFPDKKLIIEVDGDYWHANPKTFPDKNKLHKQQLKGIARDKSKDAYIRKVDNGSWKILRLWESDIEENVARCVDMIQETLLKNTPPK